LQQLSDNTYALPVLGKERNDGLQVGAWMRRNTEGCRCKYGVENDDVTTKAVTETLESTNAQNTPKVPIG